MSNIGTKIERLIADGFSYNTLRGLSESQVNLLYSRLISEKVTPIQSKPSYKIDAEGGTLPPNPKGYAVKTNPSDNTAIATPMEEDDKGIDYSTGYNKYELGGNLPVNYNNPEDNATPDIDGKNDGMPTEGEVSEKFESKSQQRLFWAKCDNARTEKAKKKWCKWAKEFSDDTDFSKLPEKKKDKKLEESLTKLVEKYIPESISKKELMSLIESSTRTKEAPGEKTKEKESPSKPKRKNPFKIEPAQKPGPKAELDEAGAGAPAKAPVKTPTKTPSKPQRKNPFKIEPAQKPGPKARRKGPEWLSYNSFINAGYRLK